MAGELLNAFEAMISKISLIPSDGGKFEVKINEELVFSKLETRKHAQPGEILNLIKNRIEER